jgi:hypothetical protein
MPASHVFTAGRLGWATLGASENAAESFCVVLCTSVEPWHLASNESRHISPLNVDYYCWTK